MRPGLTWGPNLPDTVYQICALFICSSDSSPVLVQPVDHLIWVRSWQGRGSIQPGRFIWGGNCNKLKFIWGGLSATFSTVLKQHNPFHLILIPVSDFKNTQTFSSPLLSSSNPLLPSYPPADRVSSPGHNCASHKGYMMVVPTIIMVIDLTVKVSGEVSPRSPPREHCSCQEATLFNQDGT